jgi:uncharacterized protein YndB with AHSA1/START domain
MAAKTSIAAPPGEPTIVMQRHFDAPRELVFRAYTDPEAIPRWWGPSYLATVVDQMDVRVGGRWRYVQTDPEGNVHAFRGEYRELDPPARIVSTFEYEPMAGHISTETATFEERDGGTLLTVRSVFASVEDRDGMLQSGAEEGATESWDRLAEYVRGLVAAR